MECSRYLVVTVAIRPLQYAAVAPANALNYAVWRLNIKTPRRPYCDTACVCVPAFLPEGTLALT